MECTTFNKVMLVLFHWECAATVETQTGLELLCKVCASGGGVQFQENSNSIQPTMGSSTRPFNSDGQLSTTLYA